MYSWAVDFSDVDPKTYDLSVKNPNDGGEVELRDPKEILTEINKLNLR